MIAFIPVSRYKVDFQVAAGRPYSIFERLLLEAVVSKPMSSLDEMQRMFRVHRRVVIEGLVTLVQAGWVALEQDGSGFVATTQGKQVGERPGELPKSTVVSERSDFLVGERVHGQLARGRDVTFMSKSELMPHWNDGVTIPKGAIPHPLEPGLVLPLLRRLPGEWIRGCEAINVVRDGVDFVLADVDTERGEIRGIPPQWKDMLREDLFDLVRRKEREWMLTGRVPHDPALQKFVRREGISADGGLDPDEWWISLSSDHIIVGSVDHYAILEERLTSARSYVAVVSSRIDKSAVERLEAPLRAAIARGVLVDVLWGGAPENAGNPSYKAGLELLRKIDWDSHQAGGRGRLLLGKDPSRSHAKMVVSDAGGEYEAIIGSYDWLAGDTVSPRMDVSLRLTERGPVARLCLLLGDLAAADPRLSKGAGVTRLKNAAADLERRSVEEDLARRRVEEEEDEPKAPDSVTTSDKVRARLILGRRHHTLLGALAAEARETLVVGTHRWGAYAETGFRELSRALKNPCLRVEAHYGVRNVEQSGELLGAEFEKHGGTLRHAADLHANFAVCNEDIAVVTSFNWLAPDLDWTRPSAGEIGFVLRGARAGARLLERLGLNGKATAPALPGAYVTRAVISNLRSIARLDWDVSLERAPGWHVLVGDNGSGKSTALRALALALVGADESMRLLQDWRAWLRDADAVGKVEITVESEPKARLGSGPLASTIEVSWKSTDGRILLTEEAPVSVRKAEGFFSAAYGPFRRFTGGDADLEKQFAAYRVLGRHLSMFDERIALTDGLAWLKDLHVRDLERDLGAGVLLGWVKKLINDSKLLPNDVKLAEVTHAAVVFVDSEGHKFSIGELSDGYRSILSLTLDLLRQLTDAFGTANVFDPERPGVIVAPGIVLIDEVDAHLHPSWQRTVGQWFCDHFPRVQFIVASHSALVCQASERGTVYRLPSQGDDEGDGGMLKGQALDRLIYGNVLEAYTSGAFGQGITRSESAKQRLTRLAELNTVELERELTAAEMEEQERLRGMFPASAHVGVRDGR